MDSSAHPVDDRGLLLDDGATAQDVYSALRANEIRTLLLAPGTKGAPIACELQVIPSPTSTQFEALSYVWGGTAQSHVISCNGFEFAVTESLHTALAHLRYADSWRRLWVDQICINQLQKVELRKQVAMMGMSLLNHCFAIKLTFWQAHSTPRLVASLSGLGNTTRRCPLHSASSRTRLLARVLFAPTS
jgi:hypothetical protein